MLAKFWRSARDDVIFMCLSSYWQWARKNFDSYCKISISTLYNGGGWTLISRFSNIDSTNWMQSSGNWWYDRTSSNGSVTSTSSNYDMISPAFWLVTGYYIKITRSDDSSNTALLHTSSCTGGKTFRSFITSYGNFRNGAVWNSDACRGSCYISSTHLQWASVKCTAAAIFKVVVTCHFGVTGALRVTEPCW